MRHLPNVPSTNTTPMIVRRWAGRKERVGIRKRRRDVVVERVVIHGEGAHIGSTSSRRGRAGTSTAACGRVTHRVCPVCTRGRRLGWNRPISLLLLLLFCRTLPRWTVNLELPVQRKSSQLVAIHRERKQVPRGGGGSPGRSVRLRLEGWWWWFYAHRLLLLLHPILRRVVPPRKPNRRRGSRNGTNDVLRVQAPRTRDHTRRGIRRRLRAAAPFLGDQTGGRGGTVRVAFAFVGRGRRQSELANGGEFVEDVPVR